MWQLIQVEQTNWIEDNSGYYVLINWIDNNNCRLDVMDKDDMPVVSFQGAASDVRKHVMQYAEFWGISASFEHTAYIGAELARCELLRDKYVQD